MNKLKVLELFGGIGACSKALERLGVDYEIVDYVEIDKYAVASFNAIHNTNFEPQDVCNYNKDDYTLMMVNKENKIPKGLPTEKLGEYFSEICQSINKLMPSKPLEFKEEWKEKDYGLYDYRYYKGAGAKWKTNKETVFF